LNRRRRATLCLFASLACSGTDPAEDADGSATDFAVCGNGVVDGDEVCDGDDLAGQACTDVPGFLGGTLACAADCASFDTAQCDADPTGAVVRLNEITSTEIAEGDYAGAADAIELFNHGMAAADLSGFLLSDEADFPPDKTYVFPEGSMLAPGAFLVLVGLDEATMVGDYPFGVSSTNPEILRLGDASGNPIDTADFAGTDAVISWCRVPDGDGEWQTCMRTFGSANAPGAADDSTGGQPVCGDGVRDLGEACDGDDLGGVGCMDLGTNYTGGTLACTAACTFDASGCDVATRGAVVALNELTSSDTDDIELFNAGDAEADLSGWVLTDELTAPTDPYDPAADPEGLVFAAGTTLAPGAFLVVPKGKAAGQHAFGLSGDGEEVALLDADHTLVDFVTFGLDEAATSYCRIPDGPAGAWQADCTPTFGASNGS
jgi:hypothetical protein